MIVPRRFQVVRPPNDTPRSEEHRRYRIKIEKAVRLVRTGSTVRPACRSVGLHDYADFKEVTRLCDKRGIPRRRWWGTPLAFWKTTTPNPAHVMKKSRDRDIDEEVAKIAASVRSRGWSIAAFSCH
jgi:hypothetical protein